MADELTRKIGVTNGMVHALVMLKQQISHEAAPYSPIHSRHTRKLAARAAKLAPLQKVYELLESNLRRLQAAIKVEQGEPA